MLLPLDALAYPVHLLQRPQLCAYFFFYIHNVVEKRLFVSDVDAPRLNVKTVIGRRSNEIILLLKTLRVCWLLYLHEFVLNRRLLEQSKRRACFTCCKVTPDDQLILLLTRKPDILSLIWRRTQRAHYLRKIIYSH